VVGIRSGDPRAPRLHSIHKEAAAGHEFTVRPSAPCTASNLIVTCF